MPTACYIILMQYLFGDRLDNFLNDLIMNRLIYGGGGRELDDLDFEGLIIYKLEL